MRFLLTICLLVFGLMLGSLNALVARAEAPNAHAPTMTAAHPDGAPIYRYDLADGSVGFANDPKYVPSAYRGQLVVVKPSDARWTRAEAARAPHRWTGAHPSFEQWQAERTWARAGEQARRDLEDAQALEVLAGELQAGQAAASLHRTHAEARQERLEDACRKAGCQPGFLRD